MHQNTTEHRLAQRYYKLIPTTPDKGIIREIVKHLNSNAAVDLIVQISGPDHCPTLPTNTVKTS